MSEIIDILPNNSGGQLKFRVDSIDCRPYSESDPLQSGVAVDIYIAGGVLLGLSRDADISVINQMNIAHGRPKGYGVVMWDEYPNNLVMWTPFIGDDGYIPKPKETEG